MPRLSRESRFETTAARARLKRRHQPYWRTIHPGLSIGYRKGARGGVWQVRYLKGDKYKFGVIGIADDHADADGIEVLSYKQAHHLALNFADRCEESTESTEKPIAGRYTVGHAMTVYLKSHQLHGKSYKHTQKTVEAHILPTFENRPIDSLTPREIKQWFEALVIAPARIRGAAKTREIDRDDLDVMRKRKATANRILTVLKAALNYAYENSHAKNADAWRRVKPFRGVDAPKVRHLSEDECARLINECSGDLKMLVQGALLTGCRFGELSNLRTKDYSPEGGCILIRDSKAGKPRHVPLTNEGKEFFERAADKKTGEDLMLTRNKEKWSSGLYARPLRQACERANISPPASFHVLRHTYGSLLAARGVPLQVIATAMGHADTRMTERHYAHLMPSYVADTIRANLPEFGISIDFAI